MKIFVLDTSSKAASAAVWEDGHLLADCWQNTGRTHSVTSLPMAESLLAGCSRTLEEMDALAVTAGPGSFTGLRIGMAMVKGMGFALDKPCIPLSTLEGLAWNLQGWPGLICPVMDARVGQVYTALFRWENGTMHRLMEDCAIAADQLLEQLAGYGAEAKILVGDGAQLCYNKFEGQLENLSMAPNHLLYQRAGAMAELAASLLAEGKTVSAGELAPVYLRLPQAERELKLRQQKGE